MVAMSSNQTPSQLEAPSRTTTHAPIFSEPEVVKAVVVPELDPTRAAAVFSSPL